MVAQRGSFDYIILETTGLADPGPIAETFWRNEEWDADVRLDGVVCVVDGMWGLKVSREREELSSLARDASDADLVHLSLPQQMNEKPEVEGEPTEWEKYVCSPTELDLASTTFAHLGHLTFLSDKSLAPTSSCSTRSTTPLQTWSTTRNAPSGPFVRFWNLSLRD